VRRLIAAIERAVDREASTRPAALLRIGLAVVILARFASELTFRVDLDLARAGITACLWGAAIAMLLGWRAQAACALAALAITAGAWRFGSQGGWNHHHVYLLVVATACTAITPCGRSYSLDRWRALAAAERAGAPPPPERGLVWAQHLIAVQLTAVYFWGAIDKCNPGWLRGDKFEAQVLFYIFDSDPPELAGWRAALVALSLGTVALELALAVGLWLRRARRWLVPAGVAFHVFIYMTLPVTVFSALSCLLYLAYFDPDEVHRAIDRLSARDGAGAPRTRPPVGPG
jgi:hypothetical protein